MRALVSFGQRPSSHSFAYSQLFLLVDAIQITVPLLLIVSLSKEPWSRLGIVRPRWIVDALVGCFIYFASYWAYHFALSFLPSSIFQRVAAANTAPEGIAEYCLLAVACAVGGFSQELVMRGYLIARLERLLGSTWLPVLITSLLHASYHLYQGVVPTIGQAAIGVVLAVSFCLTRRLWPLCVAHALANFVFYL